MREKSVCCWHFGSSSPVTFAIQSKWWWIFVKKWTVLAGCIILVIPIKAPSTLRSNGPPKTMEVNYCACLTLFYNIFISICTNTWIAYKEALSMCWICTNDRSLLTFWLFPFALPLRHNLNVQLSQSQVSMPTVPIWFICYSISNSDRILWI